MVELHPEIVAEWFAAPPAPNALLDLFGQRHRMRRYDEAADVTTTGPDHAGNLLREQGRPEALDGRQGAEMFAGLGPCRFGLRDLRPERVFPGAVWPLQ